MNSLKALFCAAASLLVVNSLNAKCNFPGEMCERKGRKPLEEAAPVLSTPPSCCDSNRWTGFTVGFTVGGLANASWSSVKPTGTFKDPANVGSNPQRSHANDINGGGFVGGLQLGYNRQVKVFVWGLETDFSYSSLNRGNHFQRNLVSPLSGTFKSYVKDRFEWFGTVRGRIGLGWNPVLIYGTGGFAYGRVNSSTRVNLSAAGDQYVGSNNGTPIGWAVGAGLEWGVSRHCSIKFEYLCVGLNDTHYTDANSPVIKPGYSYRTKLENQYNIGRIGFNYTI